MSLILLGFFMGVLTGGVFGFLAFALISVSKKPAPVLPERKVNLDEGEV